MSITLLNDSSHLNALELALAACPPSRSLAPGVELTYDPDSFMFYNKCEFRPVIPQEHIAALLDGATIVQAFRDFVLGEFKTPAQRDLVSTHIAHRNTSIMHASAIEAFRDECEHTLMDKVLNQLVDSRAPISDRVLQLLRERPLGNSRNASSITAEQFASVFEPLQHARLPLVFALPSFPFKDQNPFRTTAPASHIDIGEVALLIRFHLIALAITQIYPHGAHWILVTDGEVYSDLLHVSHDDAARYRETLRAWRNRLNLQATISIIDFKDVLSHRGAVVDQNGETYAFVDVMALYLELLRDATSGASPSKRATQVLEILMRGILWNINLNRVAADVPLDVLWQMLNGRFHSLPDVWQARIGEIGSIVREASLRYAAFNLAARDTAVLKQVLPHTVRATVHAKKGKGQIAAPRLGGVFPWNGVGVLRSGGSVFEEVASEPLHQIPPGAAIVTVPESTAPFGYWGV